MKIVYVLVCSDRDYYYEQALVSILSLRRAMPMASVSVLTDNESYKYVKEKNPSFFEKLNECKVVSFKKGESPKIKSRYLKTKLRELIEGNLLYVDVDTVWTGSVDEKDFFGDVMAEYDFNCPLSQNFLKEWIANRCEEASMPIKSEEYFNSGVIYFSDSQAAHAFARRWNEFWIKSCKKNVYYDQPSLNYLNEISGNVIKRMPSCYNAQLGFSMKYFSDAKIIHYFATDFDKKMFDNPFHFKQDRFWKHIKDVGIDRDVLNDIYNPKQAFDDFFIMQNQQALDFLKEPAVGLLLDVFKSTKKRAKYLKKILNSIAIFLGRIAS